VAVVITSEKDLIVAGADIQLHEKAITTNIPTELLSLSPVHILIHEIGIRT
jgi:hypothetical protein